MDLVNIDRIFILKVLWVIIKATLILKSSNYFIFNYIYTANIMLQFELLRNFLLFVILVIRFHKSKNRMFHLKFLRILELCFRTTFYHKITTYAIITVSLAKLAVILWTFYFLTFQVRFLMEQFIQKCSSKLISKIELSKSETSPLRDRKSCYLFFYSKTDKLVDSGILLRRKLLKAMILFTE